MDGPDTHASGKRESRGSQDQEQYRVHLQPSRKPFLVRRQDSQASQRDGEPEGPPPTQGPAGVSFRLLSCLRSLPPPLGMYQASGQRPVS